MLSSLPRIVTRFLFTFLFILPVCIQALPQNFSQAEDSLVALSSVFLKPNADDGVKQERLQQFEALLEETLSDPASLQFTFPKLTHVSIQGPEDRSFRIFTWFTLSRMGYEPHGIVQVAGTKKKPGGKVYILHHNKEPMRSLSYKTLDADEWFGAVYYEMLEFRYKKKKAWLLMGFNGNDGIIHKKVIDVLTIAYNGEPKFGAPVFFNEERMASRVVFQYNAKAKMSLSYHPKSKMIIFDHLAPERPGLEEQYQYYVPDLSYDGLKLDGEKWIYKKDVDARNLDENKGKEGTHYNLVLPEN
jgi:hypothetical protein